MRKAAGVRSAGGDSRAVRRGGKGWKLRDSALSRPTRYASVQVVAANIREKEKHHIEPENKAHNTTTEVPDITPMADEYYESRVKAMASLRQVAPPHRGPQNGHAVRYVVSMRSLCINASQTGTRLISSGWTGTGGILRK